MRRARGLIGIFIMFLFLGVSQLIGKSEKVRFHDFVQIAASGAMCGVALVGIVGCRLVFSGKLRLAEKKPAEENAPVPDTHRSQS
jgi:hypothetical protein